MKDTFLVVVIWIYVCLIGILASLFLFDCRSAVNVNLKQYECKNEVQNGNGTITFHECVKMDGDKQNAKGGSGDDVIEPKVEDIGPVGEWIPVDPIFDPEYFDVRRN